MDSDEQRNHLGPAGFPGGPLLRIKPKKDWTFSKNAGEPTLKLIEKGARSGFISAAPSLNGLLWRDCNEHMFSPRHPMRVCAEMLRDAESKGVAC